MAGAYGSDRRSGGRVAEVRVRAVSPTEDVVDDDDWSCPLRVGSRGCGCATAALTLPTAAIMLGAFHLLQPFGYYGFGTLATWSWLPRLRRDVVVDVHRGLVHRLSNRVAGVDSLLKRFERKYLIMVMVAVMATVVCCSPNPM